jgi:hypothetical protein
LYVLYTWVLYAWHPISARQPLLGSSCALCFINNHLHALSVIRFVSVSLLRRLGPHEHGAYPLYAHPGN